MEELLKLGIRDSPAGGARQGSVGLAWPATLCQASRMANSPFPLHFWNKSPFLKLEVSILTKAC